MRSRATRIVLWLVWIAIGGLAVYVFVMFGPLAVEERISKPSFCVTCHNMKPEYDAFNRGPHGNLDSCNACHLPNNNPVSHQFWDAVFAPAPAEPIFDCAHPVARALKPIARAAANASIAFSISASFLVVLSVKCNFELRDSVFNLGLKT